MNGFKIAGIVLVLLGVLSLAYGGFSYTKSESEMNLGPVEIEVQERERVNLPVWLGVGLVVIGGGLVVGAGRKA